MCVKEPEKYITNTPKKRYNKKMKKKLIGALILLAGILLLTFPFMPLIQFRIKTFIKPPVLTVDKNKYIQSPAVNNGDKAQITPTQVVRRLVIPKIDVDVDIVKGKTEDAMLKGAWLFNDTDPKTGGNMVMFGHRWRYVPPSNTTFYLLDKLQKGDKVYIFWDNTEYIYTVREQKIIEPNDFSILNQTTETQVTLITCTPLFIANKRLIVIAQLDPANNQ